MTVARAFFVAVLLAATVMPAAAQLPKHEIPGESPAGLPQSATPTVNPGRPTPKPQSDKLHPSNPNLPPPQPVAPKEKPSAAPNLPGSGRQEPVPGS